MLLCLERMAGFVLAVLLVTACGGRSINNRQAQDIIVAAPDGLSKDDLDIESVSQVGQKDAIAEARIRTAFKLERVEGKWVVREVRLGRGQWEKMDDILRALQLVKIAETRNLLEQVAAGIEKYKKGKGVPPDFSDYVALSDTLHPEFMTPLIRLDAWQHPLVARPARPNMIQVISPGPDGKLDSNDDIVVTWTGN